MLDDQDAVRVDEESQLLERLAVQRETFDLHLAVSGQDPRRVADVMVAVEPAQCPDAIEDATESFLVCVGLDLGGDRPPTVPLPRI